jgi:hypothetical protein
MCRTRFVGTLIMLWGSLAQMISVRILSLFSFSVFSPDLVSTFDNFSWTRKSHHRLAQNAQRCNRSEEFIRDAKCYTANYHSSVDRVDPNVHAVFPSVAWHGSV